MFPVLNYTLCSVVGIVSSERMGCRVVGHAFGRRGRFSTAFKLENPIGRYCLLNSTIRRPFLKSGCEVVEWIHPAQALVFQGLLSIQELISDS